MTTSKDGRKQKIYRPKNNKDLTLDWAGQFNMVQYDQNYCLA